MVGRQAFPIEKGTFQGRTVKLREGTFFQASRPRRPPCPSTSRRGPAGLWPDFFQEMWRKQILTPGLYFTNLGFVSIFFGGCPDFSSNLRRFPCCTILNLTDMQLENLYTVGRAIACLTLC